MYDILYKSVRHGYVRLKMDGEMQITIPIKLKGDESFKQSLIEKGEKLLKRYNKRKSIQTQGSDFILLFGEQVPISELPEITDMKKYLKETLAEFSIPILDEFSQKIGYDYNKLTIRKTESKWGSCTSEQNISLNLSLVHLPTQFIRYVIIHEVCHLKHKNHGTRFWNLVEKHFPNHKNIRKELRNFILK